MTQRAPGDAGHALRALDATRVALLSPLVIGLTTLACLLAAEVRDLAHVDPYYEFLRWNVFLAVVPVAFGYLISWAARSRLTWPALPVLGLAWMVFLPNAPYLVTDLVHLQDGVSAPNVVVLGLLAVAGLLLGVKSIQLVQGAVERIFGVVAGRMAVHAIAVLTAFGIYLGRVKRWNSWDVIDKPYELADAMARVPSQPGHVLLALVGTVVIAVCFSFAYRVLTGPSTSPELARAAALRRTGR